MCYWNTFETGNIIQISNYLFSFFFSDLFVFLIIFGFFTLNYNLEEKKRRIINNIIITIILSLFIIDIFTIYFFQSRLSVNEIRQFIINWSSGNSSYIQIIIIRVFIILFFWTILFYNIQKIKLKKVDTKILTTTTFFTLSILYFIFSLFIHPNFVDNIFSINIKDFNLIDNETDTKEIKDYADTFTQVQWKWKDLNIILVFAESLSAIDSKNAWWNDNLPNFDKIQKEWITYTNFVSNWVTSDSAHISTLIGIVPITNIWQQNSPYIWYKTYTQSLPEFLNSQWYNTTFISTAPLNFLKQRDFLTNIWFQNIIWEEYFENNKKYSFSAAPDEVLFSKALEEVQQQTWKFFIWLQTISFHKEYETPYWNTEKDAIKYVDEAMYNFYQWLKDINFFDSWILIIVWDHRKMSPAEKWEKEKFWENRYTRSIATVVWNNIKNNTINNELIQHTDIYNSIKILAWKWDFKINRLYNDIFWGKANRKRWITSSPYYANKYTITSWNNIFTFNNLSNLKTKDSNIYDYFSSYIKFELANNENEKNNTGTILIWHKWAPNNAPENSTQSFITAQNQWAAWIELDVSYTKDKKNIVAHWEYLYATDCNNKKIANYTYERIKDNCEYKNWESIKTLKETLEIIDWLFDYYFVEIKVNNKEDARQQTIEAITDIKELDMQEKVILISYDETVKQTLKEYPEINAWRDTYDTTDTTKSIDENFKYILLPFDKFTKEIVQDIKDQWKIAVTYTINTTWDFQKAKDMWINIIMTNDIPLLKNFEE